MSRKITIEFLGDSKDLQRAMNDADSASGKLKGTLAKVGKVAATGLAVGGALAAKGLWDATQNASDLSETLSKTNNVFGESAKGVIDWSKDSARSLGLSQSSALAFTSQFGDMFMQLGQTGGQAAKTSKDVVKLATDLGSFHNLETGDVLDKIAGAMRGEYDSIQKIIPGLSDARVKEEALRASGKKSVDQLTEQEKAMAALSIITKDGAAAHNDFAETSDGLANQTKILKAQLQDTSAQIGMKLLPAAAAVAAWFNDKALPAVQAFGGWMEQNFPPIWDRVQAVVDTVMGALEGTVGGKLGAIQQIFTDVTSIVTTLWDTFGATILSYATTTLDNMKQVFGGGLDVISGIFQTFSSLLKGDWSGAWDGIKKILSGAWEMIKGIVKQGLNILSTAMEIGWTVLKGIVGLAWDGIKTLVSLGIDKVVDWVKGIPGKFSNALSNLKETAAGLFRDAMDAGKEKVTSIGQTIVGWIAEIPGKLLDKLSSFRNAGASLIGAVVDGMKNAGGVIEGIASNVWTAVRGLLNSAIDRINAALEFTISLPGPDITVNPANIPHMAKGGLVTKPTLALIGEDGPEAVVPLSKKHNPGGVMPGMGSGGGVVQTIVQLITPAGQVLEQIMIQHERDTGRPLGVHTLGATS